ncbi:MAG: asparagine synthase (glutamine-hydrolyzing) [Alphaproteobacteria bacterium]
MCGIAGQVGHRLLDDGAMRAVTETLAHRGPDGHDHVRREKAWLGHRRLSIIDLEGGRQPIVNEDDTVWIVCNGEIYNYQDLRPELIAKGHKFRTDSDCETVLHLYEEEGEACLEKLRGMFAFAIWDENKQKLFCARDRLGQKPFYYACKDGSLHFASEIKALLQADPSLRRMNAEAFDEYMTLRLIGAPKSMFDGIEKLPPGHSMTYAVGGTCDVQRYWDLDYEPKSLVSENDLLDELEGRLVDCLKYHLVSDVPVGAFMSGGLDSTLLVALTKKHKLTEDLQTFTIGLPYDQYDEAPTARLVAETFGTTHREETITPSLLTELPRLVATMDEPSDSLAICMDKIADLASRHVKVVFGGDGGDELFGGYDRYYGNGIAAQYARIPAFVRRGLIRPIVNRLPDGKWYKSVGHQLKWLDQLADTEPASARYLESLGYFYMRRSFRDDLYTADLQSRLTKSEPGRVMKDAFDRVAGRDLVDRMLYADGHMRLPDHPVMISDRMTMAHGLEARAPFMDHKLVEFVAKAPASMKVKGRTLRHLQVELCKRVLPAEVMERKKQGFSSALTYMLKDELSFLQDHFLKASTLASDGLLNQPVIDRMLAEHKAGSADHGHRLWLLLNSEVWHRHFIREESAGDLTAEIADATKHVEVASQPTARVADAA